MDFARRLLFAYIITVLINPRRVWLQLMLLMFLNQFFTMFIMYTKTHSDKKAHRIESMNEIVIMLTIYHFFCFTDFV